MSLNQSLFFICPLLFVLHMQMERPLSPVHRKADKSPLSYINPDNDSINTISSSHFCFSRSIIISGKNSFPCSGNPTQPLSPWTLSRKQPRICCSISVQDSMVGVNSTINSMQRRRLTSHSLYLYLASQRHQQ